MEAAEFSTLFELLPIGAYRSTAAGRQLRANPALVRLNGYDSEAALLAAVNDIASEWYVDAHRRQRFRELIERDGKVLDFVSEIYRHKTRERIWIRENAHVVRDEQGRVRYFEGTVEDITAPRQTQLALEASERRFRAFTEKAQVLTVLCADDGRALYVSPACGALLGRPPQALTGTNLFDWVHPDDVARAHEDFDSVREMRNSGTESTHRFAHADGSWCHLASLGNNCLGDSAVEGVVLNFRDVSERLRAEQAGQALQAQLRESQKMESIGTLAGGIAHDFNNILAGILGNLALAQDALARDAVAAGHAAQVSLAQIHKSCLRARELVRQILAFSRRQPHRLVNQALRPLVEDSLALMRASLPAAVHLKAELAEEPLHAAADATLLQQVLLNLCTNAWHALQGVGDTLHVGLKAVTHDTASAVCGSHLPEGRYAHLWVADDGCGMDEATRARIFEPFFTTKPVGQGTGLGLSVVHGIVASHHGAIGVQSAPDQGSTFHLCFPLVAAAASPHAGPPPTTPWAAPGLGHHVLYIDDDEVMCVMMERLLERLGYRVTVCGDGAAALAAVASQPDAFDVVVSDFNMPGLSGLEVAAGLARLRADLPVVISSGYISDELRTQALQLGVRAVLDKQDTTDAIGTLLQGLLARRDLDAT